MKWRPILIVFLGLLIFLLFIAFFVIGMGVGAMDAINNPDKYANKKGKDSTGIEIKYVKTTDVVNQNYQVDVTTLGRVNSSQAISVSSEVQGVLRPGSVQLKKGNSFRKGQVLFRVNNGDAALLLKARKSGYLTLLANTLPDIKIDYEPHYEVWKLFFDNIDVDKSLPPMPPLVDAKLKTLLASRNILSEYYNIKADQVRLSKYTVVAPFSGTITDAFADVGAIVNPGSPVLNVINNGEMEVECSVGPEEIDLVRIGTSVALEDENNNTWTGKVIRKGMYLNPNTQSIPVFVQIDVQDDRLYNGMYLSASVRGDSIRNVFEVPRRALLENSSTLYQVKDSALNKVEVDVLLLKEETVLIGGIADGVTLVAEPVVSPNAKMKYASQK